MTFNEYMWYNMVWFCLICSIQYMHLVMMIVDIRTILFNRGINLMMVLNVLKSLTKDVNG